MIARHEIVLFEGVPILRIEENILLIDTGAPHTLHKNENLVFCSSAYSCTHNRSGVTVARISEMLGTEITTLLGLDVLSEYQIVFDYRNKMVEFHKGEVSFEGTGIEISKFKGAPIVELIVNGEKLRFYLDTGAKLSYLSDTISHEYESAGYDRDFHPSIGRYETRCFEIPTHFGRHNFVLKYGILPPSLLDSLILGGTSGIIGFDFFSRFKILLDLKSSVLKYA